MNERISVGLITAAILLVAAVLAQLRMWNTDPYIVAVAVAVAAALAFASIAKYARGTPSEDEMTRRIHEKAVTFSWWVLFVLIAAFSFVQGAKLFELSVDKVLSAFFTVLIVSYLAASAYYGLRGVKD